MERLLKHKLMISLTGVVVLAGGGAAYAATQTATNPRRAFLNDVARRLNVTPAQLRSAFQGAMIDRLQAAVKAGRLTQAQANVIEQRIKNGALSFGGGFGLHGPEGFGPPGLRFAPPGMIARFGPLAAAAKYLGITPRQLIGELRGKTLAQVAESRGKSVSGLESAMVTAERWRLDRLVAVGVLTRTQEQRWLRRISQRVARMVEHGRIAFPPAGKLQFPGGPDAAPPPPGDPDLAPAPPGGPAGEIVPGPPPGSPGGPLPPAA